jgi:alpha-L-fucosidase
MSLTDMPGDTSWFVKDRFGLFIHWGLYSLGARHEWIRYNEEMPADEYDSRYFRHFEPDLYNPEAWADAAANAGMKYFVITTKHHEGFTLWDSAVTDYKAPNTPAGRDLLRPMVDAFRARNMRVGFYHSLLDWHHNQYIIDTVHHPLRNKKELIAKLNKGCNQAKYAEYLHAQVRELLTNFGQIDILWFDYSFPNTEDRLDFTKGKGHEAWQSKKLYAMIRDLQPQVIINDRLDLDDMNGDVNTPEQYQPRARFTVAGKPVVWEACQTLSGSWGYYRDEFTWRSSRQLISTLIDCVAKAGNLLLNVGPTGRGEFDYRALQRLKDIGAWMHYHSRSIYNCTIAPPEFATPEHCKLTYNPDKKRLYVHIFDWPYKALYLDGQAYLDRIEYAQLLNDASEILMKNPVPNQPHPTLMPKSSDTPTLSLELPQTKPPVEIPVIELFLK